MDLKAYAHVIHVAPDAEHQTVAGALAAVKDASAKNRYAILVAAGTYNESRIQMKPYVDLYGGFAAGDWKTRDVYQQATILDAQKKGPVVIAADDARLDGFVITGGQQQAHGGGIVCDGVSPTIVNNIIVGNQTLRPVIGEGLGKQIANEGAGIALLSGSRAYVSNNLICDNSTEVGNGAGITARGKVGGKILRNVFCNNIAGVKDDAMFHGKVGSRSSPGGAIACSEESSPQISFNCIVMCSAPINNDAGGIWVEGNSHAADQLQLDRRQHLRRRRRRDLRHGEPVLRRDAGKRFDSRRMARGHRRQPDRRQQHGTRRSRRGPGQPLGGGSDLRRNRIVGNEKGGAHGAEGGVICVMENNIIADNGAKRTAATPSFRLSGDITARKFDARRYVTEIGTSQDLGKEDLSGSVVRIGKQWSVVKSSGPGSLVIWGKVTDEAPKVEILAHYLEAR